MLKNFKKFAYDQFKQAANLDDILDALEYSCISREESREYQRISVVTHMRYREDWLNTKGLTMSNEERILWNDLLLKINSGNYGKEFEKEVKNEEV